MSTLTLLLTDLAADVVTAAVVPSASHVYQGRRARDAQLMGNCEVWLEPLGQVGEQAGLAGVRTHQVRVHVRQRATPEGPNTGAANATTVRGHLDTLVERWHGKRPFYTNVPEVAYLAAELDRPDENPSDAEVLDGSLLLSAAERS